MSKYVIIGASVAGHNLAINLRQEDKSAAITLITEEPYSYYDRDKLIAFLLGDVKEEELFLFNETRYSQEGIEFLKSKKVSTINPARKTIYFKERGTLNYELLFLATGKNFGLPQIPGAKKEGVLLTYSLDDFKKIKNYLINDTVCLVGSNEYAFNLAKAINAKYKVAVKLISENSFEGQDIPSGIEVINNQIQEIIGEGKAEAVKFKDGKAIGVCCVLFAESLNNPPDLLKNSGIKIDQEYVLVDALMQTNVSEIYALGGVALSQGAQIVPKSQKEIDLEIAKIINLLFDKDKGENMADVLIQLGSKGIETLIVLTRKSLEDEIAKKGQDTQVAFPGTNYYLPLINALLNVEVKTLGDCLGVLKSAEDLNNGTSSSNGVFVPALGGILNKGVAGLICEEILAALAVLNKAHPQEGYLGFIPDNI